MGYLLVLSPYRLCYGFMCATWIPVSKRSVYTTSPGVLVFVCMLLISSCASKSKVENLLLQVENNGRVEIQNITNTVSSLENSKRSIGNSKAVKRGIIEEDYVAKLTSTDGKLKSDTDGLDVVVQGKLKQIIEEIGEKETRWHSAVATGFMIEIQAKLDQIERDATENQHNVHENAKQEIEENIGRIQLDINKQSIIADSSLAQILDISNDANDLLKVDFFGSKRKLELIHELEMGFPEMPSLVRVSINRDRLGSMKSKALSIVQQRFISRESRDKAINYFAGAATAASDLDEIDELIDLVNRQIDLSRSAR